MINFLNLEYFLVAAEELNFTKAAKKLFISQQSLSNHISHMERELDTVLFNRTSPMTLTYAGQVLKLRARQLLELKEETFQELSDIKDFSRGQLIIGVSHTRGRIILPEILPVYRERFPGIDLKLVEGNSSSLADGLLHGRVDLIIDMMPFKVENVETIPVCQEEILLAVPDAVLHRYFPEQAEAIKRQLSEHVDLSLLSHCPFLLIHPGNRVRTIADELFEEAQFTPNIVLETENIETVLALAMKGMGITFYPRMFISGHRELQEKLAQKTPVTFYSLDRENTHRVLAIGCHKGHYMSRAAKEFIRIAKETL